VCTDLSQHVSSTSRWCGSIRYASTAIVARAPLWLVLVLAPVAFCAMFVLSAERVHAQSWSGYRMASGSTGIVDEADVSEVAFDTTGVRFRSTAPAQSVAVIRYPVNFHLRDAATHLELTMSYQRPDEGSFAVATIKRVRLANGVTSVVGSVNAWETAPGPGVQMVTKSFACDSGCWFGEYVYHVEVQLWKPEVTNSPRVVGLRLVARVYN
jgi:hypothetical protein